MRGGKLGERVGEKRRDIKRTWEEWRGREWECPSSLHCPASIGGDRETYPHSSVEQKAKKMRKRCGRLSRVVHDNIRGSPSGMGAEEGLKGDRESSERA